MDDAQVLTQIIGKAGRITLNRPNALNALSYHMVLEIKKVLSAWIDDPAVSLIIIEGVGEKAFCAGGDIEDIYNAGRNGDYAHGLNFWRDEYSLNSIIANYPKPYVAFMHGFVMGGGVGVSTHGSHRIVCETTKISMPECGIGLIPDVGGTHLLAEAPGHLGEFAGLTGLRMGAADALYTDFADYFVPIDKWEMLKSLLSDSGDVGVIIRFAENAAEGSFQAIEHEINAAFKGDTVQAIINALSELDAPWAEKALRDISRASPLSLLCTLRLIRTARQNNNLETALENELRFTARAVEQGEFLEGIRAAIIEKDRNPKWQYMTLEDVPDALLEKMFEPLSGEG
ncbi:MAG: enoyl-CoA hydratase/isomerase family protein [Hyphomicrobiales bacterium]